MLAGEDRAGPQRGLDLVEDQERACVLGDLGCAGQIAVVGDVDAPLALDRFEDDRGRVGVEFKTRVTPILKGLQDRGVLALPAGSLIIRFLPPLVITNEQVDQVVVALGETLA